MLYTVYSFRCTNAVSIVGVLDAVKGFQLSSLFPCESVSKIAGRVALLIVGDSLITNLCQKVFPLSITVSICYAVLRLDVTVVVIHHCVLNNTIHSFCQQLSKSIIGIFRGSLNRVDYLGNPFFSIVLIGNCMTARKHNLAYKLRGCRGFQLCILFMLFGYIAGMVMELPGHKSCTELEFVKHLAAERVCL